MVKMFEVSEKSISSSSLFVVFLRFYMVHCVEFKIHAWEFESSRDKLKVHARGFSIPRGMGNLNFTRGIQSPHVWICWKSMRDDLILNITRVVFKCSCVEFKSSRSSNPRVICVEFQYRKSSRIANPRATSAWLRSDNNFFIKVVSYRCRKENSYWRVTKTTWDVVIMSSWYEYDILMISLENMKFL